jgi:hypothetical protein
MAYIGTKPTIGNFQICDAISVVNGQAAYTMQVGSVNVIPQSANHMIVSLNGTIQKPNSSFTVSGSTITFASNLATGDVIDFIQILGDVLDLGVPSDATVTAAKIGANAVTAAKLNNDIISGSTELASEPADTDEFLVSDAGTLKRIDYSLIKGGGITVADQWRITSAVTYSSQVDITANLEQVDTTGQGTIGTAMSQSSGIFTFPQTGIYLVMAQIHCYRIGDARYTQVYIKGTTNNSSYSDLAEAYSSIKQAESSATYANPTTSTLVDVTDTSNVKVKFALQATQDCTLNTSSSTNRSFFTFIRLGDT